MPLDHFPKFAAGSLSRGPLYREIQARLLQSLAEGEWAAGVALPTEPQLAQRFGVSIGTVRKAIGELVDANILIRQQGRGTFVATHNASRSLFHFFHIVGKDGLERAPQSELLSFDRTTAKSEVARDLRLAPDSEVYKVINLLNLEGVPISLDEIQFSCELFKGMTREEFANRPSTIYALFQNNYLINVVRTVERLRARSADKTAARRLGLAPGAPLLEIRRVAYTYGDRPVELRISKVNTDHHDYLNTLF